MSAHDHELALEGLRLAADRVPRGADVNVQPFEEVGHELGTPLNVIIGYAEIIDSDRATRALIHSSADTIIAQAKHMATVIRGLLDFSRQARGERSSVDLDALARDAAKLLEVAPTTAPEAVVAFRSS